MPVLTKHKRYAKMFYKRLREGTGRLTADLKSVRGAFMELKQVKKHFDNLIAISAIAMSTAWLFERFPDYGVFVVLFAILATNRLLK